MGAPHRGEARAVSVVLTTLENPPLVTAGGRQHPALARVARILGSLVIGLVSTTFIWWAFVKWVDASPLVIKTPGQVWDWMTTGTAASAHRTLIFDNLRTTLRDALLGYVVGTVAALVVASSFVLSRTAEATFLPVAMLLRSVPLVAMVPVITLIAGRDVLAVTIISGIVTFFPSLVNLTFGLRSAPRQAADLITVYGGSPRTLLTKVRLPFAMASLFASMRIAVPGAVIGALLAEWLATGKGLGYLMLKSQSTFDYTSLWAAVAVLTYTTLVLYALVGIVETPVVARFDPDRLARA
jgi:ABC-type nitrate/sulfonate/bicarbonate transport system permease component